ncbi:MAG: hypothetical protein AAB544_03685 [Patescibacteria group bacterium]
MKHLRRKLRILLIVATAMLAVGIFMGMRGKSADTPRIEYFDVDKKNFVAESYEMKRMEVWTVPEGAKSENQWSSLGLMKRSSHWLGWAAWELPIPVKPVVVYQIMVRGYDESGTEMDRVTLPWIGEETLKKEVWGIEN